LYGPIFARPPERSIGLEPHGNLCSLIILSSIADSHTLVYRVDSLTTIALSAA